MKRDSFVIAIFILSAILTVWLGIAGPVISEINGRGFWVAIKPWQTLISGVATVVTIIVAIWNVTRQIRQSARTYEEDRVARELPGMWDMLTFLNKLRPHVALNFSRDAVTEAFRLNGVSFFEGDIKSHIDFVLPDSPYELRRELASLVSSIAISVSMCNTLEQVARQYAGEIAFHRDRDQDLWRNSVKEHEEAEEEAIAGRDEYRNDCANLLSFRKRLSQKILRNRARLMELQEIREKALRLRS